MDSVPQLISIKGSLAQPIDAVTLTPLVYFSILDHFSRRQEGEKRVIGTLLGKVRPDKVVEITASFPVPHQETDETVAVDMDFHKKMSMLHSRANPKEQIVGWYSTCEKLDQNSVLFHEFYQTEAGTAVHVTVNPSLKALQSPTKKEGKSVVPSLPLHAYVGTPISIQTQHIGCQFQQIPLHLETASLDVLFRNQTTESSPMSNVTMLSDFENIELSISRVLAMLNDISAYVEAVVDKEVVPNPIVGRSLENALSSVPNIDREQFENMINTSVQDLLMLVYLSNLTKTQLAIAENLNSIV